MTEQHGAVEPGFSQQPLSADAHAKAMADYILAGTRRAYELGNRGPIRFNDDGSLHADIVEAYWRCGFYVFEGVVGEEELEDLATDLESVLGRAPHEKGAEVDSKGRPALGTELAQRTFLFARPLSDPVGGTSKNSGRHPSKMAEPEPPEDAPEHVPYMVFGTLQIMDSCLRLYGHPQLLTVAEAINGPDFTPFNEAIFIKEPGLGASVAWHQDGVTHWQSPDWDQGIHGFNFMVQVYGSTAGNGVWVIPGSHKQGKLDIKAMVDANGSDRLPDAVPLVCDPGDAFMCNRQTLHGSFANTSPDRRVTVNFGFHRRSSVLGVRGGLVSEPVVYTEERIHERSRMIAIAIDARQQRFPSEPRYFYQPLAGEEDANRWNDVARQTVVRDYNLRDLGI